MSPAKARSASSPTCVPTRRTSAASRAEHGARVHPAKLSARSTSPRSPTSSTSSQQGRAGGPTRPSARPRLEFPPNRVKNALKPDQFRLYQAHLGAVRRLPDVAQRGVGLHHRSHLRRREQAPEEALHLQAPPAARSSSTASYKVTGIPPRGRHVAMLPALSAKSPAAASPSPSTSLQKFTSARPPASPKPRSSRRLSPTASAAPPPTRASSQTIQDRKYVEQVDRRLYATDLGDGRHRQTRRRPSPSHSWIWATPATWRLELDKRRGGPSRLGARCSTTLLRAVQGSPSTQAHENHDPRQGGDHARPEGIPLRPVRQRPCVSLWQERPLPLLLQLSRVQLRLPDRP